MNTLFILFFVSLAGIVLMIGRKLAPVRNGDIVVEQPHPLIPDVQKIKHFTWQNIKALEHIALVAVLRFHVKFSNFLKKQYQDLKNKAGSMSGRNNFTDDTGDKREISKFLKIISEYKERVKHIKHRIKEEEEMK